jgi:hypothetical protein
MGLNEADLPRFVIQQNEENITSCGWLLLVIQRLLRTRILTVLTFRILDLCTKQFRITDIAHGVSVTGFDRSGLLYGLWLTDVDNPSEKRNIMSQGIYSYMHTCDMTSYIGNFILTLTFFCLITNKPLFLSGNNSISRSQWPRGLRHELSSLARTLGLWVRIPLRAWMSVCIYSVFVLSCV